MGNLNPTRLTCLLKRVRFRSTRLNLKRFGLRFSTRLLNRSGSDLEFLTRLSSTRTRIRPDTTHYPALIWTKFSQSGPRALLNADSPNRVKHKVSQNRGSPLRPSLQKKNHTLSALTLTATPPPPLPLGIRRPPPLRRRRRSTLSQSRSVTVSSVLSFVVYYFNLSTNLLLVV